MAKQKTADAKITLIEQLKLSIGNISAAIESQCQSVFGNKPITRCVAMLRSGLRRIVVWST